MIRLVTGTERACDDCLRRAWLLGLLEGHLDIAGRRGVVKLELEDRKLIEALGGERRTELLKTYRSFDAHAARAACAAAAVEAICRCDASYPAQLEDLEDPPAVMHVRGGADRLIELLSRSAVAIVGSRRPSSDGVEVARALARDLAIAGVTVLSGMALGIDSAAHAGALAGGGATVAIMAAGVERPYPASSRLIYRQVCDRAAAVSELPPGVSVRRWMFPARNRLIAALGEMTVVVEATTRSGALGTVQTALDLGRWVGAVPGRVTSPLAAVPNRLLSEGAHVVRDVNDVLEAIAGVGGTVGGAEAGLGAGRRPAPDGLASMLDAIARGLDTPAALRSAGYGLQETLEGLAALELNGNVRRVPGGRFAIAL
jgi:DNA processing protein